MIPEFSGDLIQWLRGFYYTVQTGSMSAATTFMNRNQSALTHQIKSLEEELGVKLFSGNRGKRELTAEGKFLLEKTIHIFEQLNAIRDNIGSLPKELQGEIRIVAVHTVLQHYLPKRITEFSRSYPDIQFQLQGVACREPILDLIASGRYDLGIMSAENVPEEFHVTPLFKSNVVLLTPIAGPYALTSVRHLEQLAVLPCLLPPENSTMEPFLKREFGRYGIHTRNSHMISHFETAKVYVSSGLGITFVDEFVCTPVDRERMNVIPMNNFFSQRAFSLIRRRDAFVPPRIDAFIKFLREGTLAKIDDEEADAGMPHPLNAAAPTPKKVYAPRGVV